MGSEPPCSGDVDEVHKYKPGEQPGTRTCVNEINVLAAPHIMIDTPDPRRKAAAAPSSESGLEEARLRQQAIGVKLRHMFDEVVNEPVPDEFLDILRRADQRGSGGDKA